jgi:hypothetical protein
VSAGLTPSRSVAIGHACDAIFDQRGVYAAFLQAGADFIETRTAAGIALRTVLASSRDLLDASLNLLGRHSALLQTDAEIVQRWLARVFVT